MLAPGVMPFRPNLGMHDSGAIFPCIKIQNDNRSDGQKSVPG
jgi:hypothetical protein